MSQNSRLVYSTDTGRVKTSEEPKPTSGGASVVRIQKETKSRGGKAVSVVMGLPPEKLKDICKLLKSKCATGGAVKGDNIEIQGDHRKKIKDLLSQQGIEAKLAGG